MHTPPDSGDTWAAPTTGGTAAEVLALPATLGVGPPGRCVLSAFMAASAPAGPMEVNIATPQSANNRRGKSSPPVRRRFRSSETRFLPRRKKMVRRIIAQRASISLTPTIRDEGGIGTAWRIR